MVVTPELASAGSVLDQFGVIMDRNGRIGTRLRRSGIPTQHEVVYCLRPALTIPMTTRWEPCDQSNVWGDPAWVTPGAWDTAWAAWVSELPVRTDCPIRYALLHLLRYDRARGIVPVTSTTRFSFVPPSQMIGKALRKNTFGV